MKQLEGGWSQALKGISAARCILRATPKHIKIASCANLFIEIQECEKLIDRSGLNLVNLDFVRRVLCD